MAPQNVFTVYIAPIVGNILGFIMLFSPTPAVLRIRKTGELGPINPLPYPLTAINCFGWIAYGLALKNPWLVPVNICGLVAGLFFTLSSIPYASKKMRDIMTGLLLGFTAYYAILGCVGVFELTDGQQSRMWGSSCIAILMLYYLIPLSSFVVIVRQRDASSIYLPLAAASICNGTMWGIYGLAIGDVNVWLPNGFGAILGVTQIVLRVVVGSKSDGGGAGGGDVQLRQAPPQGQGVTTHNGVGREPEALAVCSRGSSQSEQALLGGGQQQYYPYGHGSTALNGYAIAQTQVQAGPTARESLIR